MRFSDLSISSKQILVSVATLLIMAAVTVFSIWKMGTLKDSLIVVSDTQLSSDVVSGAEDTYRKAVRIIIFLLAFTTSVALGLATAIAHYITEPLNRLVEAAKAVAGGDLEVEVTVASGDEVGSLTQSFNEMTLALRDARAENTRQALQLAEQEKMASLGRLVGGVAHEVNTPIGAINSATQTSDRALEMIATALAQAEDLAALRSNRKLARALKVLSTNNDLMADAGTRVAHIVKNLRDFSTLDEADLQDADIHRGLDSALELLKHRFTERIRIDKQYGDVPPIRCYPRLLNQAVMAVLSNALDAIEDEGTITITTAVDGDEVCVAIADTGRGVPEENLPQIFEPGFTTKGVGVGLGLGLSIAHNIATRHQARFEVDSTVGVGTCITLLLPMAIT